MKTITLSLLFFVMAISVEAGVIGLFTARKHDWTFVQKTGGMRIEALQREGDHWILPVAYDINGLTAVTTKPILQNSGLVVRRISVNKKGNDLMLEVISQAPEKGKIAGPLHLLKLPKLDIGVYDVYYQVQGASGQFLGKIEIKEK